MDSVLVRRSMTRLRPGGTGAGEGRASGCGLVGGSLGQADTAGSGSNNHILGFAVHVEAAHTGCIRPDSIG